jgi:hypothetical protein
MIHADQLAELLNDIELLPEFLADESDRTGEWRHVTWDPQSPDREGSAGL